MSHFMKDRSTLEIISICICFIFASCSNSKAISNETIQTVIIKENKVFNIEEIAKLKYATIGELNTIFRADTSIQLNNGQYVILNIQNIKKYDSYKNNKGEVLNNVVVIENVTPVEFIKPYLDKIAYFILFDEFAEENSDIEVFVQTGKENTEIIIVTNEDINKYKYILIGGIDKSRNQDKGSMVFYVN